VPVAPAEERYGTEPGGQGGEAGADRGAVARQRQLRAGFARLRVEPPMRTEIAGDRPEQIVGC
jgi:hypothetical protein